MSLIPPCFLDCVVAIGTKNDKGETQWIASGFLYGHFAKKLNERTSEYRVYLVTNKHVVKGTENSFLLRFNPRGSASAREYILSSGMEGAITYTLHKDEDIDLAVMKMDAGKLHGDQIDFSIFCSDKDIADKKMIGDLGISEGDCGYALGFPMGLVGEKRNYVIVRHATIARIRDYLAGASKEILIDCAIFPGNSGGPVVSKPELMDRKGIRPQQSSYLMGVVGGYIPYQDIAISSQTKQPRIVFEENSGLAYVVPIQYVKELIEDLDKNMPQLPSLKLTDKTG